MTTIASVLFNSDDDSQDETLHASESSLSETDDTLNTYITHETVDPNLKRQKTIETVLNMTVESLNRLSHDSTVSKTDPLLEFHRSNKIRQPTPVTQDSILNYLERCSGNLVPSTPKTNNLSQFKDTFRSTLKFSQAFENRETSSTLGDKEFVNIHQKVSYSCQIYEKPKKVLKSSSEYKKYLVEQKENKLGSIEALHKTLNELRGITKISTLEKTRWDWSTFKQQTMGNENLEKSKKYLATQAFLSSVTFSQYHQVLNARRRNRLR